jgi:hypothetical protein
MTLFFNALITAILLYTVYSVLTVYLVQNNIRNLAYLIGASSYSLYYLYPYADGLTQLAGAQLNQTLYQDWISIIGISFILSGLAHLVYEAKPKFARFPIGLCGLPLLIIPAYFFVQDTLILKELVIAMYEAGAIVVGLMMYGMLSRNTKFEYIVIVAGLSILGLAYIIYWLPLDEMKNLIWVWKSFIIIGILISVHGLKKAELSDEVMA